MNKTPKKHNSWTPLIIVITLIVGIILGYFANQLAFQKRSFVPIIQRNDALEEIIELISSRYVDSISTDSLYQDAVNGMLNHLDPHTNYIPAIELDVINQQLDGNFKGIGIEFFILNDTLLFTSVLKDGPSDKAGFKVGDKLIEVDGQLVAGNGITNTKIFDLLRGTDNSIVELKVLKKVGDDLITKKVNRGTIPIFSLDAAYLMKDKKTAYIKINKFSATTFDEFKTALSQLKQEGASQLILDLRQNPGGFLDAATSMMDELLSDNKLIVYTEGKNAPKEEYKTKTKGIFESGKIAIIVDEGSASASEIIAGAIQDWDRGIVTGRTTFGKGLVQEQFYLSDGSALRLTTSRFYTPTGRSLQRKYDKGRAEYQALYMERLSNGSLYYTDTLVLDSTTTTFFSLINHRPLYSGDGIRPDTLMPYSADAFSHALSQLLNTYPLNNFTYQYFDKNKDKLFSYKNYEDFSKSFDSKAIVEREMKQYFILKNAILTEKVYRTENDIAYLNNRFKSLLTRMLYGSEYYYRSINKLDLTLDKTFQIINSPTYNKILNK